MKNASEIRGIFSCGNFYLSCFIYSALLDFLLTQKDILEFFFSHGFLNREVGQVMNDDQPVDESNHDQVFRFSMTKLQ